MGHPWLKHCIGFCFIVCRKIHAEVRDMSSLGVERALHWGLGALRHKSWPPSPVALKGLLDGAHLMWLLNVYSPFLSLLVHLEWLITPSSLADISSHSGEKNMLSLLLPLSLSITRSLSPLHSNQIQFREHSICHHGHYIITTTATVKQTTNK